MAAGTLDRHLLAAAEARAEEILASARAEADRLTASARERAEAEAAADASTRAREAGRAAARILGAARLEAGRIETEARADAAGTVAARLAGRLSRLPGEERYAAVAEALCRELLAEIPPAGASVRGDPACLAAFARLAPAPPARTGPLPAGEWGGVEAEGEGGDVRVRNTLASRLRAALPELEAEICRRLEEGDG